MTTPPQPSINETLEYRVLDALDGFAPHPANYKTVCGIAKINRGEAYGAMQRLWQKGFVKMEGRGLYSITAKASKVIAGLESL